MLAQRTGFRRNELRSLTARSFDLSSEPPVVALKAAKSKRRKNDVLPLSKEIAQHLVTYLAGRDPALPLWPSSWWRRSAEMLRRDLMEAGIAPVDSDGRVIDFHGQRTTFITSLARAGVVPATAQTLARHSDINLTMGTYTRLGMADLASAIESLPDLATGILFPSDSARSTRAPHANHPTGDAELDRLISVWPDLSSNVRRAILVLLERETGTPQQTKVL